MSRPRNKRSLRGAAPAGLLLILVGLLTVPFFKDIVGRILLFAIFAGVGLIFLVFVIGGLLLILFRGVG